MHVFIYNIQNESQFCIMSMDTEFNMSTVVSVLASWSIALFIMS